MPDRNDPRRFTSHIELDPADVDRLLGQRIETPGRAVAISFVGRRTRYPLSIGCDGIPYYVFVVTRLDTARYLGVIADPDPPVPGVRSREPFRPSGAGGVLGRLEAEAAARCNRTASVPRR